jgi:hypothetical protein
MWENTVKIHSILKEKNYKAKFLTSSILKSKIDKDNFFKKINKKERKSWKKKKSNFEKKIKNKQKTGKIEKKKNLF